MRSIMHVSVCLIGCLMWLCAANHVHAHSLEEIKQAFPDKTDVIPHDLLEATRLLENTAGMNSVREELHEKQHRLLLDYVRAHIERRCADLVANIPNLDQDIIRLRDQGQAKEEQRLRDVRDSVQTFLAANCRSMEQRR